MTLGLALGWLVAALLAWRAWSLSRRLELVAEAEHELRGPLTALALGLESARRRGAGGLVGPFEHEVGRARLALADLGAARHGRRTPARPAPVALGPLLADAAAAAEPGARAAGRALRLSVAAELPTVRADRDRLAQALDNVVANALEHGGRRVELRGRRTTGGVALEVADDGGGFRRFRAPWGSDRGRGLRIAARAVEEAGGRLSVESGESGARVRLDLPRLDP